MKHEFSLKQLNTFGIDVRAAQFAVFNNANELQAGLDEAAYTPWILGGGSNVLFTDDIERCVLKNEIGGIKILHENQDTVIVRAGGGVVWHDLVTWCIDHDLGGIENLALIPGNVGAAPIQNIGAYGVELTQVFESLRAFRLSDSELCEFSHHECKFGYRQSIFKAEFKDQYCILDVDLRLTKAPHAINSTYGAIQEMCKVRNIENPQIRDIYDIVIAIRRSKLPDPVEIGNAGSFFKNPEVEETLFSSLRDKYPDIPGFPVVGGLVKIPAGWLIEQLGWKGKRVGNVGCYAKQALVIVNFGGASGREVYDHAMRVKDSVLTEFGIELTPEVNVIG